MTEETTTTESDTEAEPGAGSGAADAPDTGATDAGATDVEATPPAKQPWYQRSTGGQTYADRYVFPAVVPLISIAVIIFYVINVSRVFLSGKGTIAIVAAAAITIAILVFAASISAAARMRSQALAIFVAVCALGVMLGGWIAVGHAQEKKAAAEVACKPPTSTIKVQAEATLKFNATSFTAKAGCVAIQYGGVAGHTLVFDSGPGAPTGPKLASGGGPGSTFAWTLKAGNYTFYCDLPGHRAAGMQATLVVK